MGGGNGRPEAVHGKIRFIGRLHRDEGIVFCCDFSFTVLLLFIKMYSICIYRLV